MCGMVEGKYLPRRTSERRLNYALDLLMESANTTHHLHRYYPFLPPPEAAKGNALQQPSEDQPTDEDLHDQQATPPEDVTEQVLIDSRLYDKDVRLGPTDVVWTYRVFYDGLMVRIGRETYYWPSHHRVTTLDKFNCSHTYTSSCSLKISYCT